MIEKYDKWLNRINPWIPLLRENTHIKDLENSDISLISTN